MKTIPVEAFLCDPVEIELADDGAVYLDSVCIGVVEKGIRLYSPPIHRRSPIARCHKKVKCWKVRGKHRISFDTRKAALEYLVRNQ